MCTVTVRIFVLGVMVHESIGFMLIYISKPFTICAGLILCFSLEKENKNIKQRKSSSFLTSRLSNFDKTEGMAASVL